MEFDPGSAALWASFGAGAAVAAVALAWAWHQRRQARRLQASLDAATTRLDEVAHHDPLTGLPTRPGLEEALDAAVARADRRAGLLALLYIDLDGLRAVNDGYGHGVGDELLVLASERMSAVAGKGALLARMGGDEFVLLLDGGPEAAVQAAQRLQAVLSQHFELRGHLLDLGASIGIASYPEHGSRARLLGHAATAMRSVKLAGGGAHAVFEPHMAVDLREQSELARDLRDAVQKNQLLLYYQPKIDAASQQITAAEALLRWNHPQRGMVSPAVFIPIAERHGLIGQLGDWVLDEAVRQAAVWRDRGLRMRVAINVSGYQMRQDDFANRLDDALKARRLSPSRFTCEITETVAMEDTAATQRAFERLGRIGVHVSVDDFGTGHSSLAALRRLPAAELKIDRAFVADLAQSADARSIVKAIVQMAHSLELRVVAEGVETEAQRDLLVSLGCDELQGYLFAKPMSATALELWAMDDRGSESMAFRDSLFKDTVPLQLL